jgi:hypothetical protein
VTYVITATNHGLSQTPCNLNQTLFGTFASEDQFSESSCKFATYAEAQAALATLDNSGDWPDGAPVYQIEKAPA